VPLCPNYKLHLLIRILISNTNFGFGSLDFSFKIEYNTPWSLFFNLISNRLTAFVRPGDNRCISGNDSIITA